MKILGVSIPMGDNIYTIPRSGSMRPPRPGQVHRLWAGQAQGSAPTFQASLDYAMENNDPVKLRQACAAFEGYFVQMMLKEMRKTVDSSNGLFPKGQAEQIFEGMLDEEIAKSVAEGSGIGLADRMYQQHEKNI